MIALIGNAPSSGSTLLADLLDSTPYSACGVEVNIFSNKKIYQFEKYKRNIYQKSSASSIYSDRNGTKFRVLHSYALNVQEYEAMICAASSLNEFAEAFARRFLALRGKDDGGILFEKTPENIHCLNDFLTTFPKSYFIHIVRNPIYVYLSLLRRGFLDFFAITTWLVDVAKFFKYRMNERVIQVRYEDLVCNPFGVTRDILKKTSNLDIPESEIKSGYENNSFRKQHVRRIDSWGLSRVGSVQNANAYDLHPTMLKEFTRILNVKVHPHYARVFDLFELSFLDAITYFGYSEKIMRTLGSIDRVEGVPVKTAQDYRRLTRKWFKDYLRGDARLSQLKAYLNPIKPS